MDMFKFVKALSNSELDELQKAILSEKSKRLNVNDFPPLNSEEKNLIVFKGKVAAILAYRLRTNQTVIVSKFMVENFHT